MLDTAYVPGDPAEDAAFYDRHFGTLVQIAISRFALGDEDAEAIAHDVLLSALHHIAGIPNPRRWLIGAVTHAAKKYRGRA